MRAFFIVRNGLKGCRARLVQCSPQTVVQPCIIARIRNTFQYASKKPRSWIATDLKPIYRPPSRESVGDVRGVIEVRNGASPTRDRATAGRLGPPRRKTKRLGGGNDLEVVRPLKFYQATG